jgi:YegS/Rv2252/BmrU family lipid kinase
VSGYLLIANAAAGSTDRAAVDAAEERLRRAGPTEVRRTDGVESLDAALDAADGRVVVVAGGDGSVHLAVERLVALGSTTSVDVGIVPLGTGNDLARGVGLPLDAAEAAAVVAEGSARPADLFVDDDGGVIVNAAHAGLGAEAAEQASGLKDALGPLAYPVGALIAGVREGGWDLEVEVDGVLVHRGPSLLVGVGNGPTIGGGTQLFPGAAVDDGLADVVVSSATGPVARAAFGAALRTGDHLERDDTVSVRGREVTVRGEAVRHNADGELCDPVPRRTYRVRPGAWRLVRP